MSAKCTPGEWSVKDYPIEERDGEMIRANINVVAPSRDSAYPHFSICVVDVSQKYPSFMPSNVEEAEANARLFAASKKMLEALRLTENFLCGPTAWTLEQQDNLIEKVACAIAAATGEQQ